MICVLFVKILGSSSSDNILRNIRTTTRYVRNFFAEECRFFQGRSNSLHSRSQDLAVSVAVLLRVCLSWRGWATSTGRAPVVRCQHKGLRARKKLYSVVIVLRIFWVFFFRQILHYSSGPAQFPEHVPAGLPAHLSVLSSIYCFKYSSTWPAWFWDQSTAGSLSCLWNRVL